MKEQSLGKTIANLRKQNNLTQAELAAQMNVTDKAVSKWERDISCPDVKSIPRLAEVLGTSVEALIKTSAGGVQREKGDMVIRLVFRVIPLAMGIAVAVTAILKEIDFSSAATMLGIGLACVGISLLMDSRSRETTPSQRRSPQFRDN